MNIEKDLKALVSLYAVYNEETGTYVASLDQATLLKLQEQLTRLLNKMLLEDTPETTEPGQEEVDKKLPGVAVVDKNYRKLTVYLHPDKKSQFIPEVSWLEGVLSEGCNNGVCYNTLKLCYQKITDPSQFKKITFENITNRDELKQWLQDLKSEAVTYTLQSFYGSLIGLLEQAGGYIDDVGQINPKGLRMMMTFFPVIFAGYGAVIFSEQLLAVYALYFIVLKGGQYLECNTELKEVGRTLQSVSVVTATATTTLLVRLLEMTFWASRQSYDVSLQIGSALLTPIRPTEFRYEQFASANVCRDLVLASNQTYLGIRYKTPELKLVSAPLESYLGLNSKQLLLSWRAGATKRLMVEQFLVALRGIDELSDPVEAKLKMAQDKLEKLQENKKVYNKGGDTALAVDQAKGVIGFLTDKPGAEMSTLLDM